MHTTNYLIVIFNCRYFQAGGNPEQVIDLLSDNYKAVAQMTNLIADWLILAGRIYDSFCVLKFFNISE